MADSLDVNTSKIAFNEFGGSSEAELGSEISISIASPDDIKLWSYGQVVEPGSINYRTYNPDRNGLFCAQIFGPTKDYTCQCGRYSKIKYKGITCERCGVEVTVQKVRRERLGHIDLAYPVAHVLFLRGTNSVISNMLDMSLKDVELVLLFESDIVIDPGNTTLNRGQLLSREAYRHALNEFGDSFKVGSGAEAIRMVFVSMDLKEEVVKVERALSQTKAEQKRRILLRRLKLLNDFIRSGNRPEWMVLIRIPVLPPELRPLVPLDGGRFVSSDLNDCYRRIVMRNNRLLRLMNEKAPELLLRMERCMLQEAVDVLFDNSKRAVPAKNSTSGRPLKSISDALKGKQGRFRQNLLGKRVDYSGRSVIIVGPNLRLHQCGLPKKMALELFKPFLFHKLIMYGYVSSVKAAKRMVESLAPEIWEILESVVSKHVVLLNRAPTLHRLGIQAFEPRLVESKAIQLHPLVCKAFNADFDGDQMAVHVPLSIEAQMEARTLMMSSNNILSPQSGKPIIAPTKDIAAGLYYMTMDIETDEKIKRRAFDSHDSILLAIDAGMINIHTSIDYYHRYSEAQDATLRSKVHKIRTTPGRIAICDLLPKDGKITLEDICVVMNGKTIATLLDNVYRTYGQEITVLFADKITALGFQYATQSGLSFGKDDMVIPASKWEYISDTMQKIKVIQGQYDVGYITSRERYNQVTDCWSECTDEISKDVMLELAKGSGTANVNSIHIMMHSGARASEALMRQLAGMRGLIAKASGEIMEIPIIANFKEGLTVQEYFSSAHGARKGAADTALKTADAGYLTRRLVDVAQDCIILTQDCGVNNGINYRVRLDSGIVAEKLSDVIFGRVLADDLCDLEGKVILTRGTLISEDNVSIIDQSSAVEAKIRSIITCAAELGVCAMCYGRELSTGKLVHIGEAVGVVAAQSIGEPGAQLTMRTFHIGGATSKIIEKSSVDSSCHGIMRYGDLRTVVNRSGENVVISNGEVVKILDANSGAERMQCKIPYAAKILFKDGDLVNIGDRIATWEPYNSYIIAEHDGHVGFNDLVADVTYKEKVDDALGQSQRLIIDWTVINKSLNPRLLVTQGDNVQASYFLPVNAIISLSEGDKIVPGDAIIRIPLEGSIGVHDITGGLPRVEEIFEARIPKSPAIIADRTGIAEFDDSYKTKNHLTIRSSENDGSGCTTYNIPKGRYIRVQNKAFVHKGDIIVDGVLDPHDILEVHGIAALTIHIVEEVQQVYRLQGVKIDNKHIEIIVHYMLQKVKVQNPGESEFSTDQQVSFSIVKQQNKRLAMEGKRLIAYKTVLQGITRASVQTDSFISAASFQETTKVLVLAAIAAKKDYFFGMKENVIAGKLIPAGTGCIVHRMSQLAKASALEGSIE